MASYRAWWKVVRTHAEPHSFRSLPKERWQNWTNSLSGQHSESQMIAAANDNSNFNLRMCAWMIEYCPHNDYVTSK